MSQLRPCPSCRRHVRDADTTCPFCSASVAPATAKPAARAVAGRLTRAAVFAGAAALAGCGTTSPAPENPDQTDQTNQGQVAPADASVAATDTVEGDGDVDTPAAPDAAVPIEKPHLPPPNMPYGAPPARGRLV